MAVTPSGKGRGNGKKPLWGDMGRWQREKMGYNFCVKENMFPEIEI